MGHKPEDSEMDSLTIEIQKMPFTRMRNDKAFFILKDTPGNPVVALSALKEEFAPQWANGRFQASTMDSAGPLMVSDDDIQVLNGRGEVLYVLAGVEEPALRTMLQEASKLRLALGAGAGDRLPAKKPSARPFVNDDEESSDESEGQVATEPVKPTTFIPLPRFQRGRGIAPPAQREPLNAPKTGALAAAFMDRSKRPNILATVPKEEKQERESDEDEEEEQRKKDEKAEEAAEKPVQYVKVKDAVYTGLVTQREDLISTEKVLEWKDRATAGINRLSKLVTEVGANAAQMGSTMVTRSFCLGLTEHTHTLRATDALLQLVGPSGQLRNDSLMDSISGVSTVEAAAMMLADLAKTNPGVEWERYSTTLSNLLSTVSVTVACVGLPDVDKLHSMVSKLLSPKEASTMLKCGNRTGLEAIGALLVLLAQQTTIGLEFVGRRFSGMVGPPASISIEPWEPQVMELYMGWLDARYTFDVEPYQDISDIRKRMMVMVFITTAAVTRWMGPRFYDALVQSPENFKFLREDEEVFNILDSENGHLSALCRDL